MVVLWCVPPCSSNLLWFPLGRGSTTTQSRSEGTPKRGRAGAQPRNIRRRRYHPQGRCVLFSFCVVLRLPRLLWSGAADPPSKCGVCASLPPFLNAGAVPPLFFGGAAFQRPFFWVLLSLLLPWTGAALFLSPCGWSLWVVQHVF